MIDLKHCNYTLFWISINRRRIVISHSSSCCAGVDLAVESGFYIHALTSENIPVVQASNTARSVIQQTMDRCKLFQSCVSAELGSSCCGVGPCGGLRCSSVLVVLFYSCCTNFFVCFSRVLAASAEPFIDAMGLPVANGDWDSFVFIFAQFMPVLVFGKGSGAIIRVRFECGTNRKLFLTKWRFRAHVTKYFPTPI